MDSLYNHMVVYVHVSKGWVSCGEPERPTRSAVFKGVFQPNNPTEFCKASKQSAHRLFVCKKRMGFLWLTKSLRRPGKKLVLPSVVPRTL